MMDILNIYVNFVNGRFKKMSKSTKKRKKVANKTKKGVKKSSRQTKAVEYVNCLVELHKLQGILLGDLRQEIR